MQIKTLNTLDTNIKLDKKLELKTLLDTKMDTKVKVGNILLNKSISLYW